MKKALLLAILFVLSTSVFAGGWSVLVSYSINGGAWISTPFGQIPARTCDKVDVKLRVEGTGPGVSALIISRIPGDTSNTIEYSYTFSFYEAVFEMPDSAGTWGIYTVSCWPALSVYCYKTQFTVKREFCPSGAIPVILGTPNRPIALPIISDSSGSPQSAAMELLLYPNPATTSLFISGLVVDSTTEILISDATGRVVFDKQFAITTEPIEIPLSGFETGVYFISVTARQSLISRRFMVTQ